MVEPGMLSHHQAPPNTCLNNMPVALRSKCDPSSKPSFIPKREDFLQCVAATVVSISKLDLLWGHIDGVKSLDVSIDHRLGIGVTIDRSSN